MPALTLPPIRLPGTPAPSIPRTEHITRALPAYRRSARFVPAAYRPLNETARAHEAEIARIDHDTAVLRADREDMLARRALAFASNVRPEDLDVLDAGLATLAADLARAEEMRAKLADAVPALRQREAEQLATAETETAQFRARAAAFAERGAPVYAQLAALLAEVLAESAILAEERSQLRKRHGASVANAGVALDYGPLPAIHVHVHLPAPDGGIPLFSDLRFVPWGGTPAQCRVVEWAK